MGFLMGTEMGSAGRGASRRERNRSRMPGNDVAVLASTSESLEDADYKYVSQLSPVIARLITDLKKRHASQTREPYSCFWLAYLTFYNWLVQSIRSDLDAGKIDPDIHEDAVRDWLENQVKPAVVQSDLSDIFGYAKDRFSNEERILSYFAS